MNQIRSRQAGACLLIVSLSACLTMSAPAQENVGNAAASSAQAAMNDVQAPAAMRPPLLREGSTLIDAAGSVHRDPRSGAWLFELEPEHENDPPYVFTLLPNSRLAEMEHVLESTGDELTFRITGDIFVHRNRNYLLPTYAPHVVRVDGGGAQRKAEAEAPSVTESAAAGEDERAIEADEADTMRPEGSEDDSIASIMRELEARTGPAPRRTETVERPESASHLNGKRAANAREGDLLVDRRGRLTRSDSGAWLFVFDSDASGRSDPSLIILPCLLLERLAEYGTQHRLSAPLLLSGRTYEYQGRSFVLPTLYRIPTERTHLTP